ncbi:hypothetical protein IFM89_009629 [Coptis chinensis]|uniref:Uncharacterized protein n=1 Tax=Coptis chinensis TaxID=261450 RepID=A0A835IUI3_9MAGN|nr:hypothetical protein IFM89_009629 [Coptis chinensis]
MAIDPSNEGGATEEKRDISSVKSDEDLALKQQLELYVERVQDSNPGIQKIALESMRWPWSSLEIGEFVAYDLDNEDEDCPREKVHRLHTRRKNAEEGKQCVVALIVLRQIRANLDRTKTVIEALIKREEKKRELLESEVSSSIEDDDYPDSDDMTITRLPPQPAFVQNLPFTRPLDPQKLAAAGIKPPLSPPNRMVCHSKI